MRVSNFLASRVARDDPGQRSPDGVRDGVALAVAVRPRILRKTLILRFGG